MGRHLCPWPDCEYEIDERLGVCYYHWIKLPKIYRDPLVATHNPDWASQPLAHKHAVAEALKWIKEHIVSEVEPTVKRVPRSTPPPTVKRIPRS